MSEEIVANFELNNTELTADMELSDSRIEADFVVYGGGTTWGNISGDITNQTDLNNALSTLQTNIQSEATARANKDTSLDNDISTINGKINTINGTLDGLGNIVTHNVNEFATAEQGALADSSLQSGDNITELVNNAGYIIGIDSNDVVNALGYTPYNASNPSGYTSNIGTVTSVNSVSPDSNGNVVISIPSAQIQSDWNQTNTSAKDYIKNKPSIPSQASDVNALPDSTKYGKSIDLSLNTTDYKLTVSLKDQDGTVLNSKVVDFPLESVVVSGAYDDNTKKVVLTLQNGSTIDFSVADLVAGLQAEITSSNKLDSDLVDDTNQTNKFVTATDISNWNGKQDSIADLSDIRDGAGAGATAVQPEDLSTVATTGSYTDLLNKPTIPSAQIQSDWNQADNTKLDYIKNKPTIPTVPSNVSAFTNDSGYITSSALSGYATEIWVTNKGYITGIDSSDVTTALGYTPYNSSNPNGYTSNVGTVTSVNNNLPDSNGNVTISGVTIDQTYDGTSANAQSGAAIAGAGFLTGITSSDVTIALGYTPYNSTNPNGYITGINSTDVTNALGYTPYNSTNPNGYITLNDIPTEIFVATYGTTTYSEIEAAYNAGKIVFCKRHTSISNLIGYTSNGFAFIATAKATGIFRCNYYYCNNNDVWSNSYCDAQLTSDKVTSLSSSSTNTQYPSAKCVYDNVKNTVNQTTADTITLYAWYNVYATPNTVYTIKNISSSNEITTALDSNGRFVGEITGFGISSSIANITVKGMSYSRNSSLDTTFTRQTLTDYNGNNLNIIQADGQWIYNESILSSSNINVGTYDLGNAIRSYLPDDGYSYEVKIFLQYDSKNTTASLVSFNDCFFFWGDAYGTGNTECKSARDSIIIKPDRALSMKIENGKPADLTATALGFRRLGTNG